MVSRTVARVEVAERTYGHTDGPEVDERDNVVYVPLNYEENIGYNVDISLLGVDPDILNIVSGNPLVTDGDGVVVGVAADAFTTPPTFSLEVWTQLAYPCSNGYRWGYTLFPRLTGGRLSGFEFDGGVVAFDIEGASCQRAPIWAPCEPEGFGLHGFGEMPFGDDVDFTCGGFGFGLGAFGVTPFDALDSPEVQVITYNRFWMNQTVPGAPAPHRQIAG